MPYVRIDSIWQMVEGERDSFVVGPDTCWFETREHDPDFYTFRPEVYGPYPPEAPDDTLWYLSNDSLSIWVFDVRVDREQSTRYLALPEDPGDELPEPARTVFEILPTNFLSGMGARVEEIRHLVRAPDSTTVVYGPVLLDRAQLAASGGEGMVEWNGKKSNGEYVEAEEEDYRTKIALVYEPVAGGRESVNSEPQLAGRDGSSKKALRIDATYVRVTGGSTLGLGNQPEGCAATLPVLRAGHFDDEGRLVMDQTCKGGFEIRKVEGHKRLRIELAAAFDAWPERPLLGEAGLVCEARWEMEGIGDGRVSCPGNPNTEWERSMTIEKDLDGHWEGMHWVPQPAEDCFGNKTLYLFFELRHGGKLLAKVPIAAQVAVFFEKGTWSWCEHMYGWKDYDNDGAPNWFEYWEDHECVHAQMAEFQYIAGDCREGGFYDKIHDRLYLANRAAHEFRAYELRNQITGSIVQFPAKLGIDACADVVVHEKTHQWIAHQWRGPWNGEVDTDHDGLPDLFEVSIGTDPAHTDTYGISIDISPEYAGYGDAEFYCRIQAKPVYADDSGADWGYPGRQTSPSH